MGNVWHLWGNFTKMALILFCFNTHVYIFLCKLALFVPIMSACWYQSLAACNYWVKLTQSTAEKWYAAILGGGVSCHKWGVPNKGSVWYYNKGLSLGGGKEVCGKRGLRLWQIWPRFTCLVAVIIWFFEFEIFVLPWCLKFQFFFF